MITGIEMGDCSRSWYRQYSADETTTDGGLVGGLNLQIVAGRNKEWMGVLENNSIQKDSDVGVIAFVLGRRLRMREFTQKGKCQ